LQANSANNAGNVVEAKEKSATARKLAIAAVIGTIIVVVIAIILKIAGVR